MHVSPNQYRTPEITQPDQFESGLIDAAYAQRIAEQQQRTPEISNEAAIEEIATYANNTAKVRQAELARNL